MIPPPTFDTMDTPNLSYERRSGNTTRQVDFAIQQLFRGNKVELIPHHSRHDFQGKKDLLNKIIKRLQLEHNLTGSDLSIFKRDDKITISLIRETIIK